MVSVFSILRDPSVPFSGDDGMPGAARRLAAFGAGVLAAHGSETVVAAPALTYQFADGRLLGRVTREEVEDRLYESLMLAQEYPVAATPVGYLSRGLMLNCWIAESYDTSNYGSLLLDTIHPTRGLRRLARRHGIRLVKRIRGGEEHWNLLFSRQMTKQNMRRARRAVARHLTAKDLLTGIKLSAPFFEGAGPRSGVLGQLDWFADVFDNPALAARVERKLRRASWRRADAPVVGDTPFLRYAIEIAFVMPASVVPVSPSAELLRHLSTAQSALASMLRCSIETEEATRPGILSDAAHGCERAANISSLGVFADEPRIELFRERIPAHRQYPEGEYHFIRYVRENPTISEPHDEGN